MTFDSRGILYSGLLSQGSLMAWNVSDMLMEKEAEILLQNPEKLVWINSVFISEGSIWIATNRFAIFTGGVEWPFKPAPLRPALPLNSTSGLC